MGAHPLDDGKERLRKLVNGAQEAKPRLPLVHGTDTYQFDDIITAGKLVPQSCDTFVGEAITYFFYGRPSYRPNENAKPTSLGHYYPVCLIFKREWAPVIKRVFPFDSGAFVAGFYGSHMHHKMKLGDFALEPDLSAPAKVITKFFGDVPRYLQGNPEFSPDSYSPNEFEAESYSSLITAKDSNLVDSRGSAVEIQISQPIDIMKAVSAVVLPAKFAEGLTGQILKAANIDPLPYKTWQRLKPNEYTSEVTNICFSYYVHKKYIKESDL
jgi:hypothetical protein